MSDRIDACLVGGAVRDRLLGLPVKDRDWVVVGTTPEAMIAAGYRPVGRDFPVFLHPDTHEEYALARTERKSGPGYGGFVFDTDPSVTLEEDLSRRDLTINAIAMRESGELVDPFGGARDIETRHLRHVSGAFVEDPVRVLRVARFMARFAPHGFTVADETRALMRRMVEDGEVAHLVAERVWQELDGALAAPVPRAFVETLRDGGALGVVLPELDALAGVPQPADSHPGTDALEHALLSLDAAAALDDDPATRLAALCHDIGKGTTPAAALPEHPGHEARGAELIEAMAARLRIPRRPRDLAALVARYHTRCHGIAALDAAEAASLLESLDAIRKPERLVAFVHACEADARGRHGFAGDYPQAARLLALAEIFRGVDAGAVAKATPDRSAIPAAIRAARVAALDR